MPAIFDITEENRLAVLEAAIKLSGKMKFVQPNFYVNTVWLGYQHFLGENEPDERLIEHMVRVLSVGVAQFHKFINNEDDDE